MATTLPKIGDPIPGTKLFYEESDIANLQSSAGPQVSSALTPDPETQKPFVARPAPTTLPSGATVNTAGVVTKPAPIVSGSGEIRSALTERGVTNADAFQVPSFQSYQDFTQRVQPGAQKPLQQQGTAQSLDVFQSLRKSQGLTALEDEDVDLETEKEEQVAAFRDIKEKLRRSGASQSALTGFISEEERAATERIDAIERRQRTIQMKVKNKNQFLSDYMKFARQDFEDARHSYEFEFNKNLQTQTAYQNYRNAEEARVNRVRDDARATLTTVNNMIANSGKNFTEFAASNPGYTQYINELEMQSGIPVGTFEAFAQSKPKANLLTTVTGEDESGNKTVSFIYANENGKPGIVETQTLAGVKGEKDGSVLTKDEKTRLNALGIPSGIYQMITRQIGSGVTLDEIRTMLRASDDGDPKMLDLYDQAVNIKRKFYEASGLEKGGKLSDEAIKKMINEGFKTTNSTPSK